MWDIKVALRDLLYADPDFRTLTGATATDKRVYTHWVERPLELSETKPGYVTIYELPGGPTDEHKSQEFYSLDIWAYRDKAKEDIYKQMRAVLHRKPLSVTGLTIRRMEIDTKFDQPIEEREGVWHKVVQVRILYAE